jgi:hypothetical protein
VERTAATTSFRCKHVLALFVQKDKGREGGISAIDLWCRSYQFQNPLLCGPNESSLRIRRPRLLLARSFTLIRAACNSSNQLCVEPEK